MVTSYFGVGFCRIEARIGDGGARTLEVRLQADQTDALGILLPARKRYHYICVGNSCTRARCQNRLSYCRVLTRSPQPNTSGYFTTRVGDHKCLDSGLTPVLQYLSAFWQTQDGPGNPSPVIVLGLTPIAFGFPVSCASGRNRRS